MKFTNLRLTPSKLVCFLCAFTMMPFSASSAAPPHDCKIQDYEMEIFIDASANHCTPMEMKEMDNTLDKVIYQIFPTVRGLEQADMTTCSSLSKQEAPDDYRRQLWAGRRCWFCRESDDRTKFRTPRRWWHRGLVEKQQCRHQSWTTIRQSNKNDDNTKQMLLTTTRNTVQKTINLSSRTTHVKIDFMLFQQENNAGNIIQVKVNGHSPVQLEYIENETSRFRKNGILSASENYIRDDDGNLEYTKVVLHIDPSKQTSNLNDGFDEDEDEDKKLLFLQFEMIPSDNEQEATAAAIRHLVMKSANGCPVNWSKSNTQEDDEESSESNVISKFERETEWILSDKLTAVLNAISDADRNHCMHGRDPVVYVNLYKAAAAGNDGKGNLVC